MEKEVSVVIPVYNSESTIVRVLDSVINQTFRSCILEVLLVDDGSTDASRCVINEYIIQHQELNIKYFYQKNKGPSAARNYGIRSAKGKYIALLDSDDIWHQDKLEKQMTILYKMPEIYFLGTGHSDEPFVRKGKQIRTLYKADIYDLYWKFFPVTPSVIFKREAIDTIGLFDETQKYCEDINYYQKFLIHFNYYYLPDNLVDIDIGKAFHGEKGLTSNYKGMHVGEMKNLREAYQMKAFSFQTYLLLYGFLKLKSFRRAVIYRINRARFSKKEKK